MVLPPKLPPYEGAVGYWGSEGVRGRIDDEEIYGKVRALHQDKIIGSLSPPVALYLPLRPTEGVACTCTKETRAAGEARCLSCHQTKRAPGYRRFLHETLFFCSSSTAGATLTNVELDTTLKPHRLRLVEGALTGTIVTPDLAYDNTDEATWETNLAAYLFTAGDAVSVEFSTDAGATFEDIADLNGVDQPIGAGQLRFRFTLTRLSADTESPAFEIFRARHPQPSRLNVELRYYREDYAPGDIAILRTWSVGGRALTDRYAGQLDHTADRSWTLPLDFFDASIVRDTPAAGIFDYDEQAAPHPFFEQRAGVNLGKRYVMTQFSYNETMGIFTHQAFSHRLAQAHEAYGLVW